MGIGNHKAMNVSSNKSSVYTENKNKLFNIITIKSLVVILCFSALLYIYINSILPAMYEVYGA